jgi:EAL domain-containing protein (putative c-di-GMP-specific phosphodiesterase class I)
MMKESLAHRRFAPGHVLFEAGDTPDAAYIVEKGWVEIFVRGADGIQRLTLLGPGEIFGEMALIDDSPRSAGARALEEVDCVLVDRVQILREIDRATPLMQLLLRTLIFRLRTATAGSQVWAKDLVPDVAAQAVAHIKSEHEVRRALKEGEIAAYLQPIVRLDDGVPIGFEALVRWHHPRRGVLGPDALLPAVAHAGLSETLDLLVVREAARMVAALNRRLTLAGRRPVFVAANFGAAHFADLRLAAQLAEILEDAQLPAERFKVEITETTLISNPNAAEALSQLRGRGMSISLDDFGTGYSGLSYLSKFPIDYLKIDGSFVAAALDVRKTADILRAMLALGAQLEIDAIAEGIENEAQATLLRSMGCRYGQGYLYGRPAPAEQACAALFDRS